MGIEVKGLDNLLKMIDKYGSEKVHTLILDRFNKVGLNFIRNARSKTNDADWAETIRGFSKSAINRQKVQIDETTPSFTDRTAQLRNSIGYVVTYNGLIVNSDFSTDSVDGPNSSDGKQEGEDFAKELSKGFVGYALICVAGANYASYVEALGYDVITGSELLAIVELEKIFG